MNKVTLVVMAAGIGSRYKGGLKQLEPVGPNGEVIMEYSIFDALEAGFNKIVFIIRKETEKEFKDIFSNRIRERAEVHFVYQEVNDIPERYEGKFKNRTKPWGTGQAILCCEDIVNEPFVVINADDFYGKEAYAKAYQYLSTIREDIDDIEVCMLGFILKNTLSVNGGVTRGICEVGESGELNKIKETPNILKRGQEVVCRLNDKDISLDKDTVVSMNMWGFPATFFELLYEGFDEFLGNLGADKEIEEYLLPEIIGELLSKHKIKVRVLRSFDKWFGVTYKEDKQYVSDAIRFLVNEGVYPYKLFI